MEIVTLIVPGFNDSADEMWQIAKFLAGISPNIPWHCTAFHSDYRMQDTVATPVETLVSACEIGREAGLHYCYAGNLPGRCGEWENTRCPSCGETVVERFGFTIRSNRLTATGNCPKCGLIIACRW